MRLKEQKHIVEGKEIWPIILVLEHIVGIWISMDGQKRKIKFVKYG